MIRHVKLTRPSNPSRYYVWLSPEDKEPLQFTRLIEVIVPPFEESPGYACVLGEIYDGDLRQKSRPKLLLDEGVALDPADFSEEEQDRYWDRLFYRAKIEEDGRLVERMESFLSHPTLEDLRQAAVALKDLWRPECAYVPPWAPEEFYHYIQKTEGLKGYPPKVDDEQLKLWFPFFRNRRLAVGVRREVPFGTDPEYSETLVQTLLRRDTLTVLETCTIFLRSRYPTCAQAIALGCNALEYWDATLAVRQIVPSDGYGHGLTDQQMIDIEKARREREEGTVRRVPIRPRASPLAARGTRGAQLRKQGRRL